MLCDEDSISLQSTSVSQRFSEGPAYLYNYIYLLLSSLFFSNKGCPKISVTLNQDDLQPSIM